MQMVESLGVKSEHKVNYQEKQQWHENIIELGAMAHACNPSTLGGQGSESQGQEIKTILANMMKPCLY